MSNQPHRAANAECDSDGASAHGFYSVSQCRAFEQRAMEETDSDDFALMQRAGERAFNGLVRRFGRPRQVVVLCGCGNNGGDGYVVATRAQAQGLEVRVLAAKAPTAACAQRACAKYQAAGGRLIRLDELPATCAPGTVVVDGLLGIGLTAAPRGEVAQAIAWANQCGAAILALDLPSGLDADSGFAFEPCIRATLTVTFIADKPGLHTAHGVDLSGRIMVESLGLPLTVVQQVVPRAARLERPALPRRAADSHKGRFGHVVIAGGQPGMLGAVLIAATAALRTGSGLVTVLSDATHLSLPALFRPELMSAAVSPPESARDLVSRAECVVLGPGMGCGELAAALDTICVGQSVPMVIDADGLNRLARAPTHSANRVLTPHPGEAGRLLGVSSDDIQRDRFAAIQELVDKYGGIVVLKGAGTLVSDGQAIWLCDRGNPGMAVGGMGDALSGIIGSLIGQGLPLFAAARAGVWLHAAAADRAVQSTGEASLLPSDVIGELAGLSGKL